MKIVLIIGYLNIELVVLFRKQCDKNTQETCF